MHSSIFSFHVDGIILLNFIILKGINTHCITTRKTMRAFLRRNVKIEKTNAIASRKKTKQIQVNDKIQVMFSMRRDLCLYISTYNVLY